MRDYDPTTGRYMQADPLGLVDGASIYGYALQNPGRYTDPTGEYAWGLAFAAAALLDELYSNDWQWKCVNWINVGLSGLGGGILGAWKHGAFAFKRGGSHSWDATRKWMNRNGIQPYTRYRNERGHWLFERNQGIGRHVPERLKNQPWNTNPIPGRLNNWMNKYPGAHLLGAPAWVPEIPAFGALAIFGDDGCCNEIE